MTAPTVEQLLASPATPFWAKDVIRTAMQKDPVDAANVLLVLAETFNERANAAVQS